jgi:hypothetical protein
MLSELLDRTPIGPGLVAAALAFMEENPELEYGGPGPLVHFAERLDSRRYEEALLASLSRRPTCHTVWMLNRLINGTKGANHRKRLIARLGVAGTDPRADEATKEQVQQYLRRFAEME